MKDGLKAFILFGNQDNEERDLTMQKFRNQEINVLISTDIISRGIDVDLAQLVINYDVPSRNKETYLHRIGRCGRFGKPGIAVTIYDRDVDKESLDEIIKYYNMESKVNELKGADHLKDLLTQL